MTQLDGRAILLTGGATLLAQGVVDALVDAGANVMIADLDEAGAQRATERVAFTRTDITQDADIAAAVAATVAQFGSVDAVVNLAATYLDAGVDTPREDWLTALNVNVVSMVEVVRHAYPHLVSSGHGAVVNFSSISSKVAQTGRWVYPASKAAIVSLTRSMAMDFAADGVRVNSVSPGWTWSAIMDNLSGGDRAHTDGVAAPFHLTGRVGDGREVGDVVAFLISDAASVVTGADWAADGGYSAMGPEQAVPAIPALTKEGS